MPVKEKLLSRLSLVLVPFIFKIITGIIFRTCRIKVQGLENIKKLDREGEPYIAAFWHYALAYSMALRTGGAWAAMVSASSDGEYIARVLESLGFETVRGSRNRRGLGALKGLITAVKNGKNAAIVADGSQGPPLIVQAGAILLASKTGAPIVPYGWGANRYFAFNSWDRTALPKPFARLVVKIGPPLYVPAQLKSDGIEQYRLKLEKQLKENYQEVWGHFGIRNH